MLLKNGLIVSVDNERHIWESGAILIQEDVIMDVGDSKALCERYPNEPCEDLRGQLVIPGLVDCHVHTAQAITRCAADDLPLKRFLEERIWVLQGSYTEEDAYIGCQLNLLEMIKSGTTSFIECLVAKHYNFNNIAQIILDSGMRACISRVVMDDKGYAGGSAMADSMVEGASSFDEAVAMHQKWNNAANQRIKVWFGPRSTGSCSFEFLKRIAQYSRDNQMGVTMHYAQGTHAEVEYIREHFNCAPWELLERTGLYGPQVSLVHGVWLDSDDIDFLSKSHTHVVHCPSSNSKIGMGTARIADMIQKGVNVGIGCDGGVSNNTYDMLQEMKMAACIQKGVYMNPEVLPVEKVLEMATIDGARVMGMEDRIGSLEVGKQADLVVLNINQPHLVPSATINPVATLVYCALGADVRDVMISGNWVMKDRVVKTMDEQQILQEAQRIAVPLYQKNNISISSAWGMVLSKQ